MNFTRENIGTAKGEKSKENKGSKSINSQRQFDCRGGYLIKIHDLINGREQARNGLYVKWIGVNLGPATWANWACTVLSGASTVVGW